MRHHYVKIPPLIQQWFPGGAPANWQQVAFDDATEGGKCLVVEVLSPNARGVRAALHGDSYYFEIGRDGSRRDAFFLMRIETAGGHRFPRSQPRRITGDFRMWPSYGVPPPLDDVGDIFGIAPQTDDEASEPALAARPSPLLVARLSSVASEVRHGFRPWVDVVVPPNEGAFLEALRAVWSRYRLERYANVSARSSSLLRGRVQPSQLDENDRLALLAAFGIASLNSLAVDETTNWFGFLEGLAALPLPSIVRAELWATLLSGAQSDDLRMELKVASPFLQSLSALPTFQTWQDVLTPPFVAAARKANDDALMSLLSGSHRNGNLLGALATWANELEPAPDTNDVTQAPMLAQNAAVDVVRHPDPTVSLNAPAEVTDVDRWVLRLHGLSNDVFGSVSEQLAGMAERLRVAATRAGSVTGFLAARELGEECRLALTQWEAGLPDGPTLRAEAGDALAAYDYAHARIGFIANGLIETDVSPSQLKHIADILHRPDRIRDIPSWMWGLTSHDTVDGEGNHSSEAVSWARWLSDPERLERIGVVIDFVDEIGQAAPLRWIPVCPQERDIDQHLRDSFRQIREFLSSLSPETVAAISAPGSGTELTALQQYASSLEHLRSCLPPSVFARAQTELAQISGGDDRTVWATALARAVDFIRSHFAGLDSFSYEMLEARAKSDVQKPTAPVRANEISVEHNWTETQGAKATLVLSRPDLSKNYGVLAAPLVIEKTGLPAAMDIELEWTVRRDGGWPSEWPDVEPKSLSIPIFAWQPVDRNKHQYPFQAKFPLRVTSTERPRLEVSVRLVDRHAKAAFGDAKPLRWETIQVEPVAILPRWKDETRPDYVREHPIGPQQRAGAILERLHSGSSVAVIAPRRFGKSTLVEYLAQEGAKRKLFVASPLVCTWFSRPGSFDHDALWAQVSRELHEQLGSGISNERIGPWPDEHAFDHARKAAKSRGFAGVVLLFDEAQLLFPQSTGFDAASKLKTLLTSHWSKSDDSRVPVVVGLIGLPTLVDRAGADLMGLMSPIFEKATMDEAELRPLISKLVPGLQTTRGARARLAETSGNLLVLKALVDALASRADAEQRIWANYDDVVEVEESLERELQAGRQAPVAAYVRDVLNSAERVEDWSPAPAFAVALALAGTRTRGQTFRDGLQLVVDLLNHWCATNQTGSVKAIYTTEIVERHVRQLEERGVIDRTRFTSNLLEAWLLGVVRRGAFDEAFRMALFAGAQRQIEVPTSWTPVTTGGEAAIYRKGDQVYRVRMLATDPDRLRFEDSAELLRLVTDIAKSREPGSPYIFELTDVGLSTRSSSEAIQVYRWIDGQDMSTSVGMLSPDLVVDIGVKLARALKLLHRYNVLHRDLCPRNIILDKDTDESLRPVLIDFGFARLASAQMKSVLPGGHVAPEIAGSSPDWSKLSDVYSLGWTLNSLLDPADSDASQITSALAPSLAENPKRRATAEELLNILLMLEDQRHLVQKREESWTALTRTVQRDMYLPWFPPVFRESRAVFVGMTLGLYKLNLERYRAIASFLCKIGEQYRPPLRGGLKQFREKPLRGQIDPVAAIVALRNAASHGGDAEWDDNRVTRTAFEKLETPAQKKLMTDGIARIAKALRVPSLEPLLLPFL